MNTPLRLVLSLVVAIGVGIGFMIYDKQRGAEWVVAPEAIADAQSKGLPGVESRPGTVTVRPIRSETADALPFKWAISGIVAGIFAFVSTRRRKPTA